MKDLNSVLYTCYTFLNIKLLSECEESSNLGLYLSDINTNHFFFQSFQEMSFIFQLWQYNSLFFFQCISALRFFRQCSLAASSANFYITASRLFSSAVTAYELSNFSGKLISHLCIFNNALQFDMSAFTHIF